MRGLKVRTFLTRFSPLMTPSRRPPTTVWGGVEGFPIPVLSCLSCLWLPRSEHCGDVSSPHTHTVLSCAWSVSPLLSACVSVWVCQCLCVWCVCV